MHCFENSCTSMATLVEGIVATSYVRSVKAKVQGSTLSTIYNLHCAMCNRQSMYNPHCTMCNLQSTIHHPQLQCTTNQLASSPGSPARPSNSGEKVRFVLGVILPDRLLSSTVLCVEAKTVSETSLHGSIPVLGETCSGRQD